MGFYQRNGSWDALVVTASNSVQARSYECGLERRRLLDLLGEAGDVVVVPDPEGRRVGSGGSTILALAQVASRFISAGAVPHGRTPQERVRSVLAGRRIMIVHAGGDSRRVPAYASCGKAFIPLPGLQDSIEPTTLLDRQLQVYLAIRGPRDGRGQIVVASGDVLLLADPRDLDLTGPGVVGTCCHALPQQASGHGVFCADSGGCVRLFLQKPSEQMQRAKGAINECGKSLLDIGLLGFDDEFAAKLLAVAGFDATDTAAGVAAANPLNPVLQSIWGHGLDIYREVACALGAEADWHHYLEQVRSAGSRVPDDVLAALFGVLRPTPFSTRVLPRCRFLHFGTSRHVIDSGRTLLEAASAEPCEARAVVVNSVIEGGRIQGKDCWIEGCRIGAELLLEGQNVLVGMNVSRPLVLREGVVLDVVPARGIEVNGRATGKDARFVRIYGVNDSFKGNVLCNNDTYLNRPIAQWLDAMGVRPQDLWDNETRPDDRSLWNARIFPLVENEEEIYEWLWMQAPAASTAEQRQAWLCARRFNVAEMAALVDHEAESANRRRLRIKSIDQSVALLTGAESCFSAKDMAGWLTEAENPGDVVVQLVRRAAEVRKLSVSSGGSEHIRTLESVRILHSLGTALAAVAGHTKLDLEALWPRVMPDLVQMVPNQQAGEVIGGGGPLDPAQLKSLAFSLVAQVMNEATEHAEAQLDDGKRWPPRISLRCDEIVWARSPARIDVAGAWSDTPPYTLEHGGRVANAAICLNGQQPIHVYVRPIRERAIRIGSIDLGTRIELRSLDELLDYRVATSDFALVKASLVLMGFCPESGPWPRGVTLERMLKDAGGGLEISTLCAIPKGSGLGTSSILGGTVLAALARTLGRTLERRQLFQAVLRLEQMLTTGGGWQDQVGGILPGSKLTVTQPGLYPDPVAYYLPADMICPTLNGGATLLYYTGITRVAKNILQQIVGRYLNRDRAALRVLDDIAALADEMRDVLSLKDTARFGGLIDVGWKLNKKLDPNCSCPQVEAMLEKIRGHIYGAKLAGAGGGGFLLIACKSGNDAARVRRLLTDDPGNDRARFFEFNVSTTGLEVTTS